MDDTDVAAGAKYSAGKNGTNAAGFLSPAPVTIRTNTSLCTPKDLVRRLEAEGVRVVAYDGLADAFQISCYDYLKALSSFQEGLFYVQDVSSMLVANTAAAKRMILYWMFAARQAAKRYI